MFTRNFYRAYAANTAGKSSEVIGASTKTEKPTLITVDGNVPPDNSASYLYSYVNAINPTNIQSAMKKLVTFDLSEKFASSSTALQYTNGVIFGSGNTQPTIDDYTLSGSPIQNIAHTYTIDTSYNNDGSYSILTAIYTITNNNEVDITIGEIGILGESRWQTSSTSSIKYSSDHYLFERTALESPITIAPGAVGQLTYTIKLDYPVS